VPDQAQQVATQAPQPFVEGKADIDIERNVETADFTPLYEQFNVEKAPRVDKALGAIWEWAVKTAPNKDRESVIFEVIKLKHRLGTGNIGDKSYMNAWNYVTTYKRMTEDVKKLEEMANA